MKKRLNRLFCGGCLNGCDFVVDLVAPVIWSNRVLDLGRRMGRLFCASEASGLPCGQAHRTKGGLFCETNPAMIYGLKK